MINANDEISVAKILKKSGIPSTSSTKLVSPQEAITNQQQIEILQM